jgi:hypothetical protein
MCQAAEKRNSALIQQACSLRAFLWALIGASEAAMNEYQQQQVALLMGANDADLVPFFGARRPLIVAGFDDVGIEACVEFSDGAALLLQIVLALLGNDPELASRLAEHFRAALEDAALRLVVKATAEHNTATQDAVIDYQGAA